MGFEPTRAEHNGLAVHRLNHSATSSFLLCYHFHNGHNFFSKKASLTQKSLEIQMHIDFCPTHSDRHTLHINWL